MAYRGDDPAPLLPSSVRDVINGWLCRMLGYLVLLACVAGGISLLTWSAADPSLTHATSGPTRNLIGPVGAILADLILQMLGLAGVFALLPPVFWALQMLATRQLHRLRYRLLFAPTAVLLLAAAASSLPSAAAWPLHHGYGGMLGDLGLGVLASLLAHVNPDRSAAAAGLFYFAAGLLVLITSLGLTQQDLKLICQPGPGGMRLRQVRGWWRQVGEFASTRREPLLVAPVRRAPSREPHFHPRPEPPPVELLEEELPYEAPPAVYEPDPADSGRGASFDSVTDHTSRAIAERFAPAGSEAAVTQAERMPQLPVPAPDFRPVSAPAPVRPAAPPSETRPRRAESPSRRPPLSMLKRAPAGKPAAELSQTALRGQARLLEDALKDFGVKGEVKEIHPGPVITLFEFEPARGVKSARVIGLADDLARAMGAASVRCAIVPGRNAIGLELPNARRERVHLRELLESDAFRSGDATLPLALGRNIAGAPVFADLARMPHLLVAGTTGAGKSVGVNAMILSLLYRLSPDQCRFLMIDPKMLELSVYNGIPHLLCPVVTDAHKAVAALNWAVGEMEERYRRMSRLAVRNIDVFNNRVRQAQKRVDQRAGDEADLAPMPYIVIVVDEFADLMIVAGKEIETAVQRLAQMARAAGIHLVMATQRPSVDIITGTIKANFPTRISFKVASKFDSRTILNEQGAEQLLGQGDMLYSNGAGRTLRVHGPFVSDDEVEGIARYLREQGEPRYIGGITDTGEDFEEAGAPAASGADDLYDRAVAIILRDQKASTSYLQRRLSIGYNRAADLMERMERERIVGPVGHGGRRQILPDHPGGPRQSRIASD